MSWFLIFLPLAVLCVLAVINRRDSQISEVLQEYLEHEERR